MKDLLVFIFWSSLTLIIYSYLIYPLILFFFSKTRKIKEKFSFEFEPTVTLLISAYNEEKAIKDKIINSLAIDYPKEKMQIIVASDGSKDTTIDIVKQFYPYGVELFELETNQGKTILQNEAIKHAKGDIVVFSDANAMYKKDAVKHLVKHFLDPNIGCVCGELKYINSASKGSGEGEGLYWKYEKFLKRMESITGNILGANGSIYAIKREYYVPLPGDIISDFVEPLEIIKKGYRAVYEPKAISSEETASTYNKEFKRKVRIITRSIRGLFYIKELLNPFRDFSMAFKLVSHKLLRWLIPIFQIILFITNIMILNINITYHILFYCQIIFYCLACIGITTGTKNKFFYVPSYLCMVNFAAFLGIINYILGKKAISWSPVRE